MSPDLWACTSCLDGPFVQLVMFACPLFDPLPFLFDHTGITPLIYLGTYVFCISCGDPPHFCHLYCVWVPSMVTPIGLHYYSVHPWPSILPLDCYCRLRGKKQRVFWVSLLLYVLWWTSRTSYHALRLPTFMNALLICSIRPCMGLLKSIMAGLRSSAPTGVDCTCNKARSVSWILSAHCFILHLTNLMHASTWLLLWWWYNGDMDCWMFSFMQNSLKLSAEKVIPSSETILLSSPNSANVILTACTQVLHWQTYILFYNWEHTVIVYNTNTFFVVNHKYFSTSTLQCLHGIS